MKKCASVILGADENAYACARGLYTLTGERPIVLCSRPLPPTSHSHILDRRVIPELDNASVFKSVLSETLQTLLVEYEKTVVIPCSDYYAELLICEEELRRKYISNPIVSESIYGRFKTKADFKTLCDELGISHPKTEIIIPSAELSCKTERSYPLVLKPSNSNSSEYLHSGIRNRKKVYICESEQELREALTSFVLDGYNRPAVIQEYIEGDESSYRVINAYCDARSRVRLIGVGVPLIEYRDSSMIGNYAAVRSVKDRALCDMAADILEGIGYVGFANFDVKISPVTGQTMFFELNPRQGRSSYFINAAGGDLMGEMYRDAVLEQPYTGRHYAENEAIWLNEPKAAIARAMRRRGLDADAVMELRAVTAMTLSYDISLPRTLTLIKRGLGSFLREI